MGVMPAFPKGSPSCRKRRLVTVMVSAQLRRAGEGVGLVLTGMTCETTQMKPDASECAFPVAIAFRERGGFEICLGGGLAFGPLTELTGWRP